MSAPTNAIESNLVENRVFPPSDAVVKAARISGMAAYDALCNEANTDFEGFWADVAREMVVWRLEELLRDLDSPELAVLVPYFSGENAELKRFQLARQLANLLSVTATGSQGSSEALRRMMKALSC